MKKCKLSSQILPRYDLGYERLLNTKTLWGPLVHFFRGGGHISCLRQNDLYLCYNWLHIVQTYSIRFLGKFSIKLSGYRFLYLFLSFQKLFFHLLQSSYPLNFSATGGSVQPKSLRWISFLRIFVFNSICIIVSSFMLQNVLS